MNLNSHDINGDEETYFGRFAMESALNGNDPEMLKSVIAAGGDVNADLGDGWTPLHYAFDYAIDGMLQNNRESPYPEVIEMIRILVAHGSDLEKRNREGKTPLDSINTYAGNEQGFNSLMAMFRGVITSLDERIEYQKRK
jgi:ankyrin repeat protein